MAEETKSDSTEAPAASAEVVVPEVAALEKEVVGEEPPPVAEPVDEGMKPVKNSALEVALAAEAAAEAEEKKAAAGDLQDVSFKEEGNVVSEIEDPEKKALEELKLLVQAALDNNEFSPPPPVVSVPPTGKAEGEAAPVPEEDPPNTVASKEGKVEGDTEEEALKVVEAEETKDGGESANVPAEEAVVTEEAKVEEPLKAVVVEDPTAPSEEEEAEKLTPPAAEEKAVLTDEDGAKTLEAIEETVVPVAVPPLAETETPAAEAPKAEKEEEKAATPPTASTAPAPEKVAIWGVPLLGDERSDTVLLKFLRARDFKVKEAMAMLKNAVLWRKEFDIEALLEEDLGVPELEKVVFMHGVDKEGHPVCYNVYGEFQNKDLYAAAFADEKKRKRFLRWRIQYLEKGIRNSLDFNPEGVSTMVQVTDLKNSIGLAKKELRQALDLLQDNYPEFAAKQVFINVPWWYLAFNRMISPFFTQRTKSKFVFAGPSKSAKTLIKCIAPEQIPVQFGGLSKENDPDFSIADAVTEVTIKPSTKHVIEIPVIEPHLLVWELRVLGSDVTYGAEFVPNADDGYTVIVQKSWKLISTDEPVVKDSFKIGEAGKVVLTLDNSTSRKKKLLYRYKIKSLY
ncbi:patellin-3-like [Zingiber officinale]|uniref:patellin-3-like n=1 Tax=Zingiber officinale TaxID=94328 RepID=UPI001C4B562C|nr:patellin-3-like [Zingiber officinale]